ncbi:MAG: ParB/RepB/Spo0J family partition protein [Rhodobacteraceae bacterium]|nr:ParB/RepB/Spo0J family partition protein [Paracoccaceae bacterium]
MTDKKAKPRGLGRGLSALMSDVGTDPAISSRSADLNVPIERVVANPNQPRRDFDQDDLDDLTSSIRRNGILQPLIVRKTGPMQYEIVAGERRWRAAQQAQLHEIPVLVRDYNDTEVLEVAIIENIQRADLNAVEEAAGFRQLMEGFGHTQEKLAEALGKSRSHIANLLRLLNLPNEVQYMVRQGKLSAGHARALIPYEDPLALAKIVVRDGLSVRATETLVKRKMKGDDKSLKPAKVAVEKDADTKAIEGDLSAGLRMKVSIAHAAGTESGKMTISYTTLDELDTLCGLLSRT